MRSRWDPQVRALPIAMLWTSIRDQARKMCQTVRNMRPRRVYSLSVAEYQDFKSEYADEWALVHTATSGAGEEKTWFYIVQEGGKNVVVERMEPSWQAQCVWLHLGTYDGDCTQILRDTTTNTGLHSGSRVWVAEVVADLVRQGLVEPIGLARLKWQMPMSSWV